MSQSRRQDSATLLDILIDGFEKNEIMHGFHQRTLPMPNEESAIAKYAELAAEARRWKGTPTREEVEDGRRISAWSDLEVRQAGRGIMVRAKAPWFSRWWHEHSTWADDPMGPIRDWIRDEARARNDERSP